jgi:hypothetical protein
MVQSAKTALTEPTGSSREDGRFQSILTLTRAAARYRGRRFFVIATNFGLAQISSIRRQAFLFAPLAQQSVG